MGREMGMGRESNLNGSKAVDLMKVSRAVSGGLLGRAVRSGLYQIYFFILGRKLCGFSIQLSRPPHI